LRDGRFFNPAHHAKEIEPGKIMMFHAKDDPNVPYRSVKSFAEQTGVKLNTLQRGGHVSTDFVVRKYWGKIEKFFGG
jgi:predicted alpha/beta hydrolase family esterase